MEKELVEAFILECKQVQEWEARFKANHIDFWDYFKDSGQTEPDKHFTDKYDMANYRHKYESVLRKDPLLSITDPVVRWYFQNPGDTLYSIAIKFAIPYNSVRRRINKYLSTKKNLKGEKIFKQ
tara:strand:- start:394 stop:765 length:372 start_codon:yes stop_codon:yes gene_type:complete